MLLFRGDRGRWRSRSFGEPEEGKSSLAISAAQLHARGGRKVLLIDADFRQSSVSAAFKVSSAPGLTELMAGQQSMEDVLREDPATGLHYITAAASCRPPHDYIAGGRLTDVIDQARGRYELLSSTRRLSSRSPTRR
jgi:tyrosine-protein kinase Etk/Wzc